MRRHPVQIRVGLPYAAAGALARAAAEIHAPTLISAGALWRKGRGFRMGEAAYTTRAALDSAGFTAMVLGGYRWTVSQYVDFVCTNGGGEWASAPFPWEWWSAMDFCVEPEIAANRDEIERRIALTTETFVDCLEHVQGWREEGVTDVPDPMPILQGRLPTDYSSAARELAEAIDRTHACRCPFGEECEAEWHREYAGLPPLVGVGSVCRRHLHGNDGLLAVLAELDASLPAHVGLHLFGVKGSGLDHMGRYAHRITSVDSMAWDFAARRDARKLGIPYDTTLRASHLRRWYRAQLERANASWEARTFIDVALDELRRHPPDGLRAEDVEAFVAKDLDRLWEFARHARPAA